MMLNPRFRSVFARFFQFLLASTALGGAVPAFAQSLPSGGQVVSGGITIGAPSNGALAITQSSPSAIVNWQSFSIGQGHRVDIAQPNAQAAILNRVTGDMRSIVAGQLNATGQVYLVNPNGIAITQTGQVNAAGFVASSLAIANDDFNAGRLQFRGSGASASVTNRGTITIGRGGYAALMGGTVSNAGTITVPLGRVGLASGERATLDLSGDGFLQVAVPTAAGGRGALVRSSGRISADGGSVILTAAAAQSVARQAVNLSGTIGARSVSGRNGSVTLSGGEGTIKVASTALIDASSQSTENGGRVRVRGGSVDLAGTVDVSGAIAGRVALRGSRALALSGKLVAIGSDGRVTATAPSITSQGALIDVSGTVGGGTVEIGGGRQGGGRLTHAQSVDIDGGTIIRADATEKGSGGNITVWSDNLTRFVGTISAKGGPQGGNGGEAEVSSHGRLAYDGKTILTAIKGSFGTLLLDPYNVTISNGADSNQSGFVATGDDSVINTTTLQNALATANVTVATGAVSGAGAQAGNITVAAPISWNSSALLTLSAANAIAINAYVYVNGYGRVTLTTGTTAVGNSIQPLLSFARNAAINFRIAANDSPARLTINDQAYRLIYTYNDLINVVPTPGIFYALATFIRFTSETRNGNRFAIPTFAGTLEGLGNEVAELRLNYPEGSELGLIGSLSSTGTVRDVGVVSESLTGRDNVGALVGRNAGVITQSYASASINGNEVMGGLVGLNESSGWITRSQADVFLAGFAGQLGGLVGKNLGTISQSHATGAVFMLGRTSGISDGGLVGWNDGIISEAYATGGAAGTEAGGLVGTNTGTVTKAYWDTQTTGQKGSAGGIGLTTRQLKGLDPITGSGARAVYFSTAVNLGDGTNSAFAGGANGVYPYLVSFFPNGMNGAPTADSTRGDATQSASTLVRRPDGELLMTDPIRVREKWSGTLPPELSQVGSPILRAQRSRIARRPTAGRGIKLRPPARRAAVESIPASARQ
jgi:filamentous hemagglutinin family protein